ncbi:hypothetical protein ACUXAQ_000928 [Staphylococcus pasteuri]
MATKHKRSKRENLKDIIYEFFFQSIPEIFGGISRIIRNLI